MASKLDLVNQVLSEIGRLPVNTINDSPDAQLISFRLDIYLTELLTVANWVFAVKYKSDSTPITQNFSPDFLYTYQLPPDFGSIFILNNATLPYMFVNGYLLSNQLPITYYYIVNSAEYEVLPIRFQRMLALYTASKVCLVLTQNEELTTYLTKVSEVASTQAIQFNDMQRMIVSLPYSDFDRIQYV